MEKHFKGVVVRNTQMIEHVYNMVLAVPRMFDSTAVKIKPGQFIGLFTGDSAQLLPRPLGICEVLAEDSMIRLVYRTEGKGTEIFSRWEPGVRVTLLGPLGNGFTPVENAQKHIIVGGGMGVVPLLELAKAVKAVTVLGFADEVFLVDRFKRHCKEVHVATDSGRHGVKGNVMDVLNGMALDGAALYACGPKPMLKALSVFAAEKNLPLQISIEERMACGIGSCLGCAVKSGDTYKRVCKDGPVFDSRSLSLEVTL